MGDGLIEAGVGFLVGIVFVGIGIYILKLGSELGYGFILGGIVVILISFILIIVLFRLRER